MTANVASFQQNYNAERKNTDIVEKDIRKWVESVAEFKASFDKQKSEVPLEKHLKKSKKLKVKKKTSLVTMPVGSTKIAASGPRKASKGKKQVKKPAQSTVEKQRKKETEQTPDPFEEIKDSYKSLKLPQNWTSGVSGGRIVFNRIKVTTHNCQQKMVVERSLVITKDGNIHVLINGSEITLNNWEAQKAETVEDVKRAIKDIDTWKICEGLSHGQKSPQCSVLVESKTKTCEACKSEPTNPPKLPPKKSRTGKKPPGSKGVSKQKSFQN